MYTFNALKKICGSLLLSTVVNGSVSQALEERPQGTWESWTVGAGGVDITTDKGRWKKTCQYEGDLLVTQVTRIAHFSDVPSLPGVVLLDDRKSEPSLARKEPAPAVVPDGDDSDEEKVSSLPKQKTATQRAKDKAKKARYKAKRGAKAALHAVPLAPINPAPSVLPDDPDQARAMLSGMAAAIKSKGAPGVVSSTAQPVPLYQVQLKLAIEYDQLARSFEQINSPELAAEPIEKSIAEGTKAVHSMERVIRERVDSKALETLFEVCRFVRLRIYNFDQMSMLLSSVQAQGHPELQPWIDAISVVQAAQQSGTAIQKEECDGIKKLAQAMCSGHNHPKECVTTINMVSEYADSRGHRIVRQYVDMQSENPAIKSFILLEKGVHAKEAKEFDKAIALLEEARTLIADDAAILFHLAEAQEANGVDAAALYREAIGLLEVGIPKGEDSSLVSLINLCFTKPNLCDIPHALAQFEKFPQPLLYHELVAWRPTLVFIQQEQEKESLNAAAGGNRVPVSADEAEALRQLITIMTDPTQTDPKKRQERIQSMIMRGAGHGHFRLCTKYIEHRQSLQKKG